NLEFDLAEGRRGSRYEHARELLTALTGAEAALVVNNNAAAVLLALATLARGREVVISRGELIEIGGEFRIPEILAESGAALRGGPQAGIICGRAEAVAAMERSPLLRTYRVDKTTLAALEATLLAYLQGREADLPLWSMALAEASEIERRAGALRAALGDVAAKVELAEGYSTTGGGSAPGCRIPTVLLE